MTIYHVKAGTYWRTLDRGDNIVEVIKMLESGYTDELLVAVRVEDPNQIVNKVQLNNPACRYYRCKKDGSWYNHKQTPVQYANRQMLSLEWQAKGALASLCRALRSANQPGEADFLEKYVGSNIRMMKIRREARIKEMKAQALIQKNEGG